MFGEARWIVSTPASGLYAASVVLGGGSAVTGRLHAELQGEIAALGQDLAVFGLAPGEFFAQVIPLATRYEQPLALAEMTLLKLQGPASTSGPAARLAARLQSLNAAAQVAQPQLLEELELRSQPLREQWESRGPGMLAALRRLTEPEVVVDEADVILVQPVLGGGGAAHNLYNSLHIEAVLANPIAELPEIVRLGWLWAQLNLDLPKYHEHAAPGSLTRIGPLALLLPALAAAEEVELAYFSRATIATAQQAWQAPAADVDVLWSWWETYCATQPTWSVALGALEQMLRD